MAAAVISEVSVLDPVATGAYRTRAAASIAAHRGRSLARGGAVDLLEGERAPRAVVVVAFPDVEAARAWHRSPAYAEARPSATRRRSGP